jgi:branched-chain amino acid transport system substrate-binding protein
VQVADLNNRTKIRETLAYKAGHWKGVTGDITLSSCLDEVGDAYIAKRENEQWNFYSSEDLKVPRNYTLHRDEVRSLPKTNRLRRTSLS